ncbi:hypothetical protein QQ045_032435 [Rhodiola kirilowii]
MASRDRKQPIERTDIAAIYFTRYTSEMLRFKLYNTSNVNTSGRLGERCDELEYVRGGPGVWETLHAHRLDSLEFHIMTICLSIYNDSSWKRKHHQHRLEICKASNLSTENKEMPSSPKVSRTGFHARSVSLPSRPHPTVPEYDAILCRLKSSESASSSSSSIRNNLASLQDLHDCLCSLMLFPETQQALAKQCHGWTIHPFSGFTSQPRLPEIPRSAQPLGPEPAG